MDGLEEKQFRMQGRVVVRKIGTDTLLVPVNGLAAGGRVFPMNQTAECIWACLSGGGTPLAAAECIMAKFEVDRETALSDCVACARELVEEKLLEEVR